MAQDDAHSDPEIDGLLQVAGAVGDAEGPEVDEVAIRRWRAGELSDEAAAAIEGQLADDPAGRAFAMGLAAEVDPELVDWAVAQFPSPRTSVSGPTSPSPRRWAPYLALAAAVVIAAGIWRVGPWTQSAQPYTPAAFRILAPMGADGAYGAIRGDGAGAHEINAGQVLEVTITPILEAERGAQWLGVLGAREGGALQWLRAPIQLDAEGRFHTRIAATDLFGDQTGPWTLHLVILQDPTLLPRLRGVSPDHARARIEGVWQTHSLVYRAEGPP